MCRSPIWCRPPDGVRPPRRGGCREMPTRNLHMLDGKPLSLEPRRRIRTARWEFPASHATSRIWTAHC
ncbi:hypothetical protein DYE20_01690 [[Mycobacterium] chelonae subsp. gwanakae]|nr:hypothetical protein DYE20_01690 [[Mycobacterium] chelonae subsp. gwanakae]